MQLTHDGQRTGSCPPTHCSVLLGLKPYQPNYRKKGSELPLLLCASVEPRLARAHDGNAAERTHSQHIAQCCCLKNPGRLGRPSISSLRRCASAQRLSSRSSRRERERLRISSGSAYKKTRTAEVTICIIPERTARSTVRFTTTWVSRSKSARLCNHCKLAFPGKGIELLPGRKRERGEHRYCEALIFA